MLETIPLKKLYLKVVKLDKYDMIKLRTANNITRRHSQHGTRNRLQSLNQICKTCIKRQIFDDFDEID